MTTGKLKSKKMDDQNITNETIVSIGCKTCKTTFSMKAGDHLGENSENIAWGCPECITHVYGENDHGCVTCGSTLGIDAGEAEPDYNSHFCSVGCYYKKADEIFC